ncbi:DUF378 domain-containing protein [Cognatilysobacter terrigena]|uniref:DUF378 domain-containing protein n=1 Tax=Cognatilysobacter terrigena TaxID=2488749 RepID=UPI00105D0A16|nr:DUF378 domain-containing protein [Lysobacter terrigena]
MRALNTVTFVLLVLGGLNWGLIGLAQFDLVGSVFGGATSPLSRMVDLFFGASALWQITRLVRIARGRPTPAPTG